MKKRTHSPSVTQPPATSNPEMITLSATSIAALRQPLNLSVLVLLYLGALTSLGFGAICFIESRFSPDIPTKDKISYVDALFFAASSTTGTGLLTYSLFDLHPYCYIAMVIMMLLGNHFITYLPIMFYKRSRFQTVIAALVADKEAGRLPTKVSANLVREQENIHDALGSLCMIYYIYLVIFLSVGFAVISNHLQIDMPREDLIDSGVSEIDQALILAVSAFSNTGISPDHRESVYLLETGPTFRMIVVLVLFGDTLMPLGLHLLVQFMYHIANCVGCTSYRNTIRFLISHPRKVSAQLFTIRHTLLLLLAILCFDLLQYGCFLSFSFTNPSVLAYTSSQNIAVMGLYQTILNRSSGFRAFPDITMLGSWVHFVYMVSFLLQTVPHEAVVAMTEEKTQKGKANEFISTSFTQMIQSIANRLKSTVMSNMPVVLSCFFLIILFEFSASSRTHPPAISLSTIAFECVAAFSGVGLSIGLAGSTVSLTAILAMPSKVVIVFLMFYGRITILPRNADPSVDFTYSEFISDATFNKSQGIINDDSDTSLLLSTAESANHS